MHYSQFCWINILFLIDSDDIFVTQRLSESIWMWILNTHWDTAYLCIYFSVHMLAVYMWTVPIASIISSVWLDSALLDSAWGPETPEKREKNKPELSYADHLWLRLQAAMFQQIYLLKIWHHLTIEDICCCNCLILFTSK